MIYIYTLSDNIGNTRYVGQTNDLRRRYNDHISSSFNEKSDSYNTYKARWIRKILGNGGELVMDVIEECVNLSESNFSESFYLTSLGLKLTNSYHSDVTEFSKETRRKMSEARLGKSLEDIFGEEMGRRIKNNFIERSRLYWTGRKKSSEMKSKVSATLKEYFKDKNNHWAFNKKLSPEHKEKMRISHLDNPKNVGNKAKRTEEQKDKIRNKISGSKISRRLIIQKDLDNNFIKEWKSLREIENSTNLSRSQISKCCKSGGIYANFYWVYGDYAHKLYRYSVDGELLSEYESVYKINDLKITSSELYKYINSNKSYIGFYWSTIKK